MARLTDKEIDYLCQKIGFIKVIMKQGYEEKKISVNDVVKELKLRTEGGNGTRGSLSEKEEGRKQKDNRPTF